jgi:transposase
MMGTRKTYSDEFRQGAVKLVTEQHLQRSQVARDLGIDPQTLRRWLREFAPAADAAPARPQPATDTAELARLRRENEQLRMERDILKKALGIFSQMPQ